MKKIFTLLLSGLFLLSACSQDGRETRPEILPPVSTVTTNMPTVSLPTLTLVPTPLALVTPTINPGLLDRPAFLAWPLPASVGLARISQYPDTRWTWNYLGLNAGYACPPMFGYLLNLDSLVYWRDISVPEDQDKAQADPHNFEMVECYAGHHGTDIKAAAGTAVYAAADGKVQQWQSNGLNSMLVLKHCLGGTWDAGGQCLGGKQWYTTYMHLVLDERLLQENADVVQGAGLGVIYDQTINSHLHLEVGLEKRSSTNFINPWGRDEAPWLGCMWLDASICVQMAYDGESLAFRGVDEKLFWMRGEGEAHEISLLPALGPIYLWGEKLVALDAQTNLWLWDGSVGDWQTLAEGVLEVQVAPHRLAMLDGHQSLWAMEGGNQGAWRLQAEDALAFSVSDHRIGYLTNDGRLFAKDGGLESDWVPILGNVLAFQLVDNRLAYLDSRHNLYANEGELLSEYQQMGSNVRAFQVTNLRLGMLDADYNLFAKEGNLRATWLPQAQQVLSFQLADQRILVQGNDGRFRLKEGNLYQAWQDLPFKSPKEVFFAGPFAVYAR